jgi:uroporphyrinogen decarboxylase
MTSRERFLETYTFGRPDAPWFMPSLLFWNATVERWHREGLPADRPPAQYFGYDMWSGVPVNSGGVVMPYCPAFETEALAEDEETITRRDYQGIVKRDRKDDPQQSMSQFLEFPVKSREDFEALKWRLDPSTPQRYGEKFEELCREEKADARDYPLVMGVCGFFGAPRYLFGVERLLVTYYEDPQLLRDIQEHMTAFYLAVFERVLPRIELDTLLFWEDMCYKNGPLISPAFFREFMLPYYQRLTDCARSYGVPVIMVDTDGDATQLLSLFIEGGVNAMVPFEQAAGMDVLAVRARFGKKLAIWGGIDKRALSRDLAAIEQEVRPKVAQLYRSGGFVPSLDHSAPPDIPFKNFCHFVDLLRQAWEEAKNHSKA